MFCRCPYDSKTTLSLRGNHDLIPRRIHSDHHIGAELPNQSTHVALTTSDIQNPAHIRHFCGHQRKNLFDVFRVRPFGETLDPPRGMALPQAIGVVRHHGSRLWATTVRSVGPTLSFSIWPSPERDWHEVQRLAAFADSGRWRTLWYADHFMPNTGDESRNDGPIHECWAMIAAITSMTHRVRVGSLVSPTTVRHPAVLANTAATIDRLGDGRLTLGIGAGWQINEHVAYGMDLMDPKERVDRFEEAVVIIRSLLRHPRTTFSGQHFTMNDAPCQPEPVQHPLPLLVGTGGPRMSRITATHADEWNTWGTTSVAQERLDSIRNSCERIGRDPATLRTSVQALFFLVDDAGTASRLAERAPEDRSVIGDRHDIAAAFARYKDLGFDEIIIPDFTLGATPEARLESYHRIADEVIPLLA